MMSACSSYREPLGKVSAKTENARWLPAIDRNIEVDFQAGKTHAQISARRGPLVKICPWRTSADSFLWLGLSSLLPRVLGGPVALHQDAERLFIGSVANHLPTSLAGDNPPNWPSGSITRKSKRRHQARDIADDVAHEPVVSPASPTLTFGNKAISSATYSEANGMATVTVNSTIPVIATFGNDGRTITISAATPPPNAPAGSTTTTQNIPPSTAANPAPAPVQAAVAPTSPSPAVTRRYFAVVDASHGGDDHGETLSSSLLEKDVTVALARSLRQELESRGITTLVLRDSDANLPVDQRAVFANADHAAIYVALHAASSGKGVRVYTALMPLGADDRGPFRSWTTAQRNSLPMSQSAASLVAGELQKRQIPVRDLAAPLRPLNSIIGPAIAVEVAPQGSDVAQLTAPDYQQLITSAVATAIAAARDQLGATP